MSIARKLMMLSPVGVSYDTTNATYSGVSFALQGGGGPLRFKPDGTKMYGLDFSTGPVYQYTLSSPWDLSAASYDSVSWTIPTISGRAYRGMYFKPDGTSIFLLDDNSNGAADTKIRQFTLSTPWDISSAGSEQASFVVGSQTTTPYGMAFKDDDGEKVYVMSADKTIYEYNLSSGWDISTASYNSVSFAATAIGSFPREMQFDASGKFIFITGQSDRIYELTLTTPWDISSASFTAESQSFVSVLGDNNYYGFSLSLDLARSYLSDITTDNVYQIEM